MRGRYRPEVQHGPPDGHTVRDVMRTVGEGRDPRHTRAADCMTKRPMTVRPADNLSSAIRLMRAMGVRHLPVVEAGRPVGFLSLRDVLRVAPDGARR